MPPAKLEVAVFNASSALTAAKNGAHRVELCADYALGGVTPSLSTLQSVRSALAHSGIKVPINVMIRPRGGDFVYSASELAQMKEEIEMFGASGEADGFVFGVLAPCVGRGAGQHERGVVVDVARNMELVQAAGGLPCTFHRAIDEVFDVTAEFERLVACGFSSVLTSGGEGLNAVEGADRIKRARAEFGGRISVIAGGGVRSGNVRVVRQRTGVEWVHSAAITGEDETADGEEVKRLVNLLEEEGRELRQDRQNC